MIFGMKRKLGKVSGWICVAVGGTVAADSILHGVQSGDWRSWFFGGVVGGVIAWLSYRAMNSGSNIRVRETTSGVQGNPDA